MPTHTLTIKKPKAAKAKGPTPIQRAGTHVWLSVEEFVPATPRVVLVSDGEGVFTGVFDPQLADETCTDLWSDAQTGEDFDSVISHWRELPEPPAL